VRNNRRKFLGRAVALAATFGAGMASIPFFGSLKPSARTTPPREVIEFPKLQPGQVLAHSTPWLTTIYIIRRTTEQLRLLAEGSELLRDPLSKDSEQPEYAQNNYRSLDPEYLVVEAECTHLGCHVSYWGPGEDDYDEYINKTGGFFCPCHGSKYDLAGRVVKNVPAPRNLIVPDYEFVSDSSIRIFTKQRS
jgi:ubiquinol-cytochrome c reductase iron-sulfur subunit